MKKTRVCSFLLAILMALSLLPVPSLAANNDSNTTVKIVSFADGRNTDLRDSELLVAKVEGYSGDVTKLIYKWTYTPSLPANTSPWPHLYIFNSQNMTNTKSATINSGSKQGVGYMYASLSSHSSSKRTPSTSIKVEVYDGSTLLCDATYSGFVNGNLELDLKANAVGLFVGESVMARDLFGQMGVTHITCANSSVKDATLSQDANTYIQATQRYFQSGQQYVTDYEITGVSAGKATITLTVSKTSFCAFHEGQRADAEVAVYVFEKPTYTPTANEIILGNTKSGYTYTIGGQSYTALSDDEEIVFTGLEPNTSYQIIVSALYGDGKPAYTYVPATTKPLTRVSVMTLLDWVPATLDKINSLDGSGLPKSLKLKPVGGGAEVPLTYNPNGWEDMYIGYAYQGTYNLCDERGNILSTSPIVVANDVSGGVNHNFLSFFSVTTKVGNEEVEKIPYLAGSMVLAPAAPDNDFFTEDTAFSKWKITTGKQEDVDAGKTYQPGGHMIANIQQPIVLEAQTVEALKIKVDVRINYQAPYNLQVGSEAGHDINYAQNNYATVILWRSWNDNGTTRYEEVARKYCSSGEIVMDAENSDEPDYTEYTDLAFIGLPAENPQGQEYTYSVTLGAKPNYSATVESMQTFPEDIDCGFDATLDFAPICFDLAFGVKVPEELQGTLDAVDLKITYWDGAKGEVIIQHKTAGVTLTVPRGLYPDSDGYITLNSTYPVWKFDTSNNNSPYWYGLEIQGYRLKDEDGVTYSIVAGNDTPVSIVDAENTIEVSFTGITQYDEDATDGTQQSAKLIATLQGKPTTIKFDLNGGGRNNASMEDQTAYFMPDQKNLIPGSDQIKEGYVFQGWYTDTSCTQEAPAEGTMLYDKDNNDQLTLYAKWAKPVSFNGTVTATHLYNGAQADPSDWLKTATVLLQRRVYLADQPDRDSEDGWETCVTTPVELTTEGSATVGDVSVATNSGNYKFENMPSASPLSPYEYRVRVVAQNYDSDPKYTSDGGIDEGVVAPVTGGSNYEININLPDMKPESVDLDYQIDVSKIGSAFRSDLGLERAYIGFNPTGGVPSYTIIKQMKDGKSISELDDSIGSGIYSGTQSVWKVHTHGTLSRYQLGLGKVGIYNEAGNSLITEKLDLEVDESLPYTIERADEVYYNTETQQPTGTMKITLIPKTYIASINLDGGKYASSPGGNYTELTGGWSVNHTWSQDTPLTNPTGSSGRTFTGWRVTDANGNDVTSRYLTNADGGYSLKAELQENVTLTALWSSGGNNGGTTGSGGNGGGGTAKPTPTPTPTPTPEEPSVSDKLNTVDHTSYVQGYADGTVRPENQIRRSEIAVIFFRLLTDDYRQQILSESNLYSDVSDGIWYNTAVSTLSGAGIIKGLSDGTFGGERPITRAQFAAIAARFDDGAVDTSGISFSDTGGHWAEREIKRAAALGWVQGYADGSFRPEKLITRAEAITIINRMLGRDCLHEDSFLDGMKTFSDNPPSKWYYEAVQEATNSHTFERDAGGYELWRTLPDNPDWGKYE